ncbi:MAG: hypothetical protein R3E56_09435 [Burkholderiaceae bacterium]
MAFITSALETPIFWLQQNETHCGVQTALFPDPWKKGGQPAIAGAVLRPLRHRHRAAIDFKGDIASKVVNALESRDAPEHKEGHRVDGFARKTQTLTSRQCNSLGSTKGEYQHLQQCCHQERWPEQSTSIVAPSLFCLLGSVVIVPAGVRAKVTSQVEPLLWWRGCEPGGQASVETKRHPALTLQSLRRLEVMRS